MPRPCFGPPARTFLSLGVGVRFGFFVRSVLDRGDRFGQFEFLRTGFLCVIFLMFLSAEFVRPSLAFRGLVDAPVAFALAAGLGTAEPPVLSTPRLGLLEVSFFRFL